MPVEDFPGEFFHFHNLDQESMKEIDDLINSYNGLDWHTTSAESNILHFKSIIRLLNLHYNEYKLAFNSQIKSRKLENKNSRKIVCYKSMNLTSLCLCVWSRPEWDLILIWVNSIYIIHYQYT